MFWKTLTARTASADSKTATFQNPFAGSRVNASETFLTLKDRSQAKKNVSRFASKIQVSILS
jgi:hypothetical protein